MSTVSSVFTADQLLAMPDDGWRYELIQGELRRMSPAGQEHGRIAMNFGWRLAQFVRQKSLGVVYAAETGFLLRRQPDTVRAPDVAFVSGQRLATADQNRPEKFFAGAPDLAVEFVSPSDTFSEVEEKVFDWLDAGTYAVLVINPPGRDVSVYRSKTDIRVLTLADSLELSDVVLGFSVSVKELFE